MPARCKIVLLVGDKHSGKTTVAEKIAKNAKASGFDVAGILAPSVYRKEKLVGFDIVNIRNSKITHLADREPSEKFTFTKKGLQFGIETLNSPAAGKADLIIVDEFGPMELAGKNWRKSVDSRLKSSDALLLLVVRSELADKVKNLYTNLTVKINAINQSGIKRVITMLKKSKKETASDNKIYSEIIKYTKRNRISCKDCFRAAAKLDAPLKTIGRICNEKAIRICDCQLGCFK